MKYGVVKLTIRRDTLYSHYKAGSEIETIKEPIEAVNMISDEFVLAEMLDNLLKERNGVYENYRTDEGERDCA